MTLHDLFSTDQPIIGMVHLLPLPGTPAYAGSIDAIYERAEQDAAALIEAGIDGFIVENFGDEPYFIGEPTPAQFALMAGVTAHLRNKTALPIGVNVQFNAWQAEIAIAHACRAQFVRVEVFVDTVLSAQGTVQPCSAQITRYRQALNAQSVKLFADIQTKYTQNIIPQAITQSALDARAAGADALIVTGAATGQATPLDAVQAVKQVVDLPVLVGSGTNHDSVEHVLQIADGAIVGSAIKIDGNAQNAVSLERTRTLMDAVRAIRA